MIICQKEDCREKIKKGKSYNVYVGYQYMYIHHKKEDGKRIKQIETEQEERFIHINNHISRIGIWKRERR